MAESQSPRLGCAHPSSYPLSLCALVRETLMPPAPSKENRHKHLPARVHTPAWPLMGWKAFEKLPKVSEPRFPHPGGKHATAFLFGGDTCEGPEYLVFGIYGYYGNFGSFFL